VCHRFEQILMSATQTMEDVNTTVLILLAASTIAVGNYIDFDSRSTCSDVGEEI